MNETKRRIDWIAVREQLEHNQNALAQAAERDPAELLAEFRRRAERLRLRQNEQTRRANLLAVLVFRIGDERYAVELRRVAQVHACPQISPVPNSSAALLGLASFQGDVLSVLDPSAALGTAPEKSETGYVLLLHREQGRIGLWVERAEEVLDLDLDDLSDVEASAENPAGQFVRGVSSDYLLLLDLDRLLPSLLHHTPTHHAATSS